MEICTTNKQNLIIFIMRKIVEKLVRLQIKAFTLVETLLTLMIVVYLSQAYQDRSGRAFSRWKKSILQEFEHLYQESQKIALRQTRWMLVTARNSNAHQTKWSIDSVIADPKTI